MVGGPHLLPRRENVEICRIENESTLPRCGTAPRTEILYSSNLVDVGSAQNVPGLDRTIPSDDHRIHRLKWGSLADVISVDVRRQFHLIRAGVRTLLIAIGRVPFGSLAGFRRVPLPYKDAKCAREISA